MNGKYVDYKSPPVIEVVFGVTFDSEALSTAVLGGFWHTVHSEFPNTNDQQPLPHTIEGSGERRVLVSNLPNARRIWMWSDANDWLIQLQPDRFLINWKRDKSAEPYPGFVEIFEVFKKYLARYQEYVRDISSVTLSPVQYELTYVNEIDAVSDSIDVSAFDAHIDHIRNQSDKRFLDRPIAFRWMDVYQLPNNFGALRVSTQHLKREDEVPLGVRLELTARGFPPDKTETDIGENQFEEWFDRAHEWVVQGFSDLTNRDLQQSVWERRR